ncbi:cystathionine gamma-lyase [Cryptococcus gattii E566]|uniref:cystathionine gamma-lyase n=1 Tax=Cryptococcus gattii serotype B (strain WM276 / ATCC MYA-4071) TaxID=367775 RepID=E6RG75_CRYGW|nr:Cystathionine gamma-lyase, putative [Cryptococcus gattii WM276]ADV25779.1 Cystathionine gamma-lyase, putative [Cryptococcus gattii WM276]KIY32609.1 cystathionine gamma-lyase [Cryptococcus gattii E566]KJE01545.1 cystathionine gamma-lyase [Cryptococcus gattii NT-10]
MSYHQFATRAIHVGSEPDPSTGAVVPSLSVATTFKQDGINKTRGFDYSRSGNPTRSALERLLTSLDTAPSSDAQGESFVFSSGSAATAAMAHWVTLTKKEGGAGGADGNGGGGHVLAVNDVYGGTARYFSRVARPTGLDITYLNMIEAGEEGIRAAIRPDTRLVWMEIPTNPTLLVHPLQLVSSIVKGLPDESRPLIVVDTTFLSSFNFTPLVSTDPDSPPLADIAYSSLSKYSSGHSDIIMGSVTLSPQTARFRPELIQAMRFLQNSMGACPSPHDCHLMIRSLKTLSTRMIKHGVNALRIAAFLDNHPQVGEVCYPGYKEDRSFSQIRPLVSENLKRELEFLGWKFPWAAPSAEETKNLKENSLAHVRTLGIPFGGVVTFTLKDGTLEQTEKFCTSLNIISLAESLGGVESLIEVPSGMTHASLSKETREKLGITDSFLRFSVGIEDYEDLIEDLESGFAAIKQ